MSLLLYLSLLLWTAVLSAPFEENCVFEVDFNYQYTPLLSDKMGILYPELKNDVDTDSKEKWRIEIPRGNLFIANCLHSDNYIRNTNQNNIEVKCIDGQIVESSLGRTNIEELVCTRAVDPKEILETRGNCFNGSTLIEVKFDSTSPPYTLYSVCHNEKTDETLYTQSYIVGSRKSKGSKRPRNFQDDGLFPNIDVKSSYNPEEQIRTLAELLGSEERARNYIQSNTDYHFNRGHLTPNGDPIERYEKRSTYRYINVVPQWKIINSGNWANLENTIRDLSKRTKSDYMVWTGTHGVLKLIAENGTAVEIWLGRKHENLVLPRRLPVPNLMWKVIYNQNDNTAVAIVQINNPWLQVEDLGKEDVLCRNICDKLSWVNWRIIDTKRGYTYCCDVASFKKNVAHFKVHFNGDVRLLDK